MKRHLQFDITDSAYVILESGNTVFEVAFQGLKFDSRAFYQGIYSKGRSANIVLEDTVEKKTSKSTYVFKWVNGIIEEIRKDLCEEGTNESDSTQGDESSVDQMPEKKRIILFDMSVCAGTGDFISSQDSSGQPYETTVMEADYALRISGHSMEPTLSDGEIVLVKASQEPINGQVVVVNIDGKSMVKRYCINNNQAILMPDNDSGEYQSILLDDEKEVRFQGIVLNK